MCEKLARQGKTVEREPRLGDGVVCQRQRHAGGERGVAQHDRNDMAVDDLLDEHEQGERVREWIRQNALGWRDDAETAELSFDAHSFEPAPADAPLARFELPATIAASRAVALER